MPKQIKARVAQDPQEEHQVSKAPLDYRRGPEKTWVYGALACAIARS